MNWFVWRQHRKTFLIFTSLLAIFAVFVVLTGNHFWHTYQHALSTCSDYATPSDPRGTCDTLQDSLFQGDGPIFDSIFATGLFVPLLLGLFLGSPLLAKEYEEGTNKLAWTQSVSRRKWLTTRLIWALCFAALYGLALTLLTTWWSRTGNALYQNRFNTGEFAVQGLVPVAYSLFFTAIGFTMGAWFHKSLVGLGVALAAFVAFQVTVPVFLRQHYMPAVTVTAPMGPGGIDNKIPQGANWILTRNIFDKDGKVFDSFSPQNMPAQCWQLLQDAKASGNGRGGVMVKASGGDNIDNCLNAAGYHQVATYQPAYRYWDFQRIEAGIYLGLTAVATGATYWLVLRRDA